MLEVKRLRLLREFAIRGTISEVAEALSYSPSAVSQQLTLLEQETGTALLRKVGRRLVLTPQGERLVADTEEVLNALERAETTLRDPEQELVGVVRVGAFQSAVLHLLPTALSSLRTRHPQLRTEVVQHEPETALHENWARGFDLVIAEQYPGHAAAHHPGLVREVLGLDQIWLAVPAVQSPEFRGVETISEARNLPWVMEPHGAASRHWAEQACRSAGFEPEVRYETADIQAHLRLVESGNAVALVNGLSVHEREGGIRLYELPGAPSRTIFTSTRESNMRHPAIIAVREALTEAAALLPLEAPAP